MSSSNDDRVAKAANALAREKLGINQPQDFKSKLNKAVSLQAANLLQKAQLDMMATKIVLTLRHHRDWFMRAEATSLEKRTKAQLIEDIQRADLALERIGQAMHMTRDETTAARNTFVYPDERIQAVIDRATQEIADILLEDV